MFEPFLGVEGLWLIESKNVYNKLSLETKVNKVKNYIMGNVRDE